ncbi:MAG: hypothetical protein O2894_10535 [Planctomycetota bacterium]|nr:hypothetical protein [Planctomycetota bacterium]
MQRVAIGFALLLLCASSARAEGWRDFTGQPAPEVSAVQWLNHEGEAPSLKSLKGKAWLLVFMGVG